jgi:hypothetical protein
MPEKPLKEERAKFELAKQAVLDYVNHMPVSVRCPECNEPLIVTPVEAVATYWVTCPNRCLVFNVSGFEPAD